MENNIRKTRRVRKFQITKNSKNYKELEHLCFLSKNIYNYTLHILKMLWLAGDKNSKNTPEYYLNELPKEILPYVVKTTSEKKNKKTGETELCDYYDIVVKTSTGGQVKEEKALYTILGTVMNQTDFRSLQCTAARGSVKLAVKSVKAFRKLLVDYYKNPSKYAKAGKPRFPSYKGDFNLERKDGRSVFSIDSFKTDKKTGTITINSDCELESIYIDKSLGDVKQIRIVPKPTMELYTVEVIYEFEPVINQGFNNLMGIDIGINNMATLVISDKDGSIVDTIIIDGKPLKSINQFYNKTLAHLNSKYIQYGHSVKKTGKDGLLKITPKSGKKRHMLERKRFNKIETYMHQASKMVIDLAFKYNVGTIFIGHNAGWKQNANMGKKNNQNFIQIPFNKFIHDIMYKGEFSGIDVIELNESHTSKCSALDNEEICHHDTYLGKRGGKHNKQFVTKDNILINADVNGSLNILRRGIDTLTENKNSTVKINQTVFTPTRYNIGMKTNKNAVQIFSDKNQENMSESYPETENFLKLEATVDSHNDEKSPFKK